MDSVFLLSAALYATLFWAISWRFPWVALTMVFGSAPFQNDISGGVGGLKFSFTEVNLMLAVPLLVILWLQGERKAQLWPFFGASALYFAVCLASSLVVWRGNSALTSLFQMLLYVFVLVWVFSTLGRRPNDYLPALWALVIVSTFLALMLLVTRNQFIFNLHKNAVGSSISCAFIVVFELFFHYKNRPSWHKWAIGGFSVILLSGLMISLSRGAWLCTLGGIIFITIIRREFILLTRIAVSMIPVIGLAWSLLPQESREYATSFDAKRQNIKLRYENNDAAIAEWQANPLLGSGVGIRKQYDATQLVLFTLAETGIIGLVAFVSCFGMFFVMVWKTQKRVGHGELAYSLLAIGGGLMFGRLLHGMVDHYWTRGATVMAWSAAGMATSVLWIKLEGSFSQRVVRARALLAIHLFEMRRHSHRGLRPPPLSRFELEGANQAVATMKTQAAATLSSTSTKRNGVANSEEQQPYEI